MSVLHDMSCEACGRVERDVPCDNTFVKVCACGHMMEIDWQLRKLPYVGIHPRERAVIWYNPKTGKHATPGRNDVPMPDRYRQAGYVRREFETLRDLDAYCQSENLVNERANYNSGNAYDD